MEQIMTTELNEFLEIQRLFWGTKLSKEQQTAICNALDNNPEARKNSYLEPLRVACGYGTDNYGTGIIGG
jgi:hypothetical protein